MLDKHRNAEEDNSGSKSRAAEEFHALGIPIGIFLIIHYPAIRHRFGILAPAMQMHTDGQTEDLSWEQFAV